MKIKEYQEKPPSVEAVEIRGVGDIGSLWNLVGREMGHDAFANLGLSRGDVAILSSPDKHGNRYIMKTMPKTLFENRYMEAAWSLKS